MSCFYHVTSQKATAVSHSFTCNFTGPDDLNLIIGKFFYFEVYIISSEGLRLLKELPVNGRISAAISFRRKGRKQDSIVIVTEKADAAIIDCIKRGEDHFDFFSFASGNIGDNCSISSDWKHEIIVDPTSQIILFKFFDGIFKAILMRDLSDGSGESATQALNIHAFRVEDGHIKGIFSLYGSSEYATIGFFVEDNKVLNMKTIKMSFNQVEITPDEWRIDALPPDTQFIIPVEPPYFGILIVGNKNVCYYNRQGVQIPSDIPIHKACTIVCYEKIDVQKYLLGDILGYIYLMYLFHEGPGTSSSSGSVPNTLNVFRIGEACIPETITYLDNRVVFIGSTIGDSQLIEIMDPTSNNMKENNGDNRLESEFQCGVGALSTRTLQTYTNVGPIMDIELMEVNGQNQLLLCSGAYKEGSIKVVRNGIGIQELIIVDQPGMQEVWSLQFSSRCYVVDLLIFSWPDNTKCMILEEDDLRTIDIPGVDTTSYTILLTTVCNNETLLQVTDKAVRVIPMRQELNVNGSGVIYWQPDYSKGISSASGANNRLILACGSLLYDIKIELDSITVLKFTSLPYEVAWLYYSETLPNIAVVTFWIDNSVALIDLITMNIISKASLDTCGILSQSLLIVQFQYSTSPYLMIGMDNGNLIYFQIDLEALHNNDTEKILSESRKVTIGTGPHMNLSLWDSIGQTQGSCVFVCSNHPSIIHCSEGRLLFSSINLKNEVVAMCPLNSPEFKNCLVLVSESNIIVGSIDKIQKLHVRSVPLGEGVRRMAIQRETDTLGIATMRFDTYNDGKFVPARQSVTTNIRIPKSQSGTPDISKRTSIRKMRDLESSHFVLLNQTSLETIHVHSFFCNEDIVEQATCITTMRLPISIISNEIVSQEETTNGKFNNDGSEIGMNYDNLIGGSTHSRDVKWEPVFVIGTAYLLDDENEPSHGCIYIIHFNDRSGQTKVLKKFQINGTPFSMQEFDGRLLVAINNSVQLVDVTKAGLHVICRYDDNIMVLYLKRRDDFILLGDLMRSVTLLRYKPNVAQFELIAKHRAAHWTTAIEIVDDDKFLVAEGEMNIFVVTRDFVGGATGGGIPHIPPSSLAATASNSNLNSTESNNGGTGGGSNNTIIKEDRFRMIEYASMHTGEVINKFISGNILMQPLLDESSIKLKNSILYGSTTGTIGQVFEINKTLFTFLKAVENQMQSVLVPIGNFSHESWRSFVKVRQCKVAERFIDGDLVEHFQDLELEDKAKIVKDLQIPVDFANEVPGFKDCTVEDLNRVIEELSRYH